MRPIQLGMIAVGLILMVALLFDVYLRRPSGGRSVVQIKALPTIQADDYLYLGIFSLRLVSQGKR